MNSKKMYNGIKDASEKMQNIDKKSLLVSVMVAILFIFVWGLFAWHLNDYSISYRSLINDTITAQTEEESIGIAGNFDSTISMINYLSQAISSMKPENVDTDIQGVLQRAKQNGVFDIVVFVYPDGTVYFPDGVKSQAYDAEQVLAHANNSGKAVVYNNKDQFLTDDGSYIIMKDVKDAEGIKGYLIGVVSYNSIVNDDEIRRKIVHDELLLDQKTNIVARIMNDNTVDAGGSEVKFFDYVQTIVTEDDYNEFVRNYNECINAGISGRSVITVDGQPIVYIYYPIPDSDGWVIMNCYPNAVIESQMSRLMIKSVLIFALICMLMIMATIIIIRYVGRERKKLTELEYLDGLTGAFNRSAFVSRVEDVLKANKNFPYYMICFDVVNFRIINETYGHERSDVIIKATADACKEAFGHNEVYGRLTADVFTAVIIDDGEEDERIKFIENKVAEEARKVYINHPIKIKRGRYEIIDPAESVNRMIDKANIARKYIDNSSNVLICQYSEDLLTEARKNDEIESKMESALHNGEFKPYLQVKYDMLKNRVCGAEALVRWIKEDGTVVPPGDFIPLFEKNGFVEKVDFFMLESICQYLRRMIDEGREVYTVSVNQSRYLMNDPEYVNKVKSILLRYRIPVGLIELELTETVFFHEKERMVKMMNDLKAMNVNLSIDDFGSGYSSFNILKDVPFDVLKIDREFLTDSVHTEKGKWILKEIVEMAHGLGMSVICEGVETKEQAELLLSLHCHRAQGFYYSRPIPMEEFIEKYNEIIE